MFGHVEPKVYIVAALAACALVANANAQEASAGVDAAQANNPLANFTAVNFQNYYIGRLTAPDQNANQFWVRYAQPLAASVGEHYEMIEVATRGDVARAAPLMRQHITSWRPLFVAALTGQPEK